MRNFRRWPLQLQLLQARISVARLVETRRQRWPSNKQRQRRKRHVELRLHQCHRSLRRSRFLLSLLLQRRDVLQQQHLGLQRRQLLHLRALLHLRQRRQSKARRLLCRSQLQRQQEAAKRQGHLDCPLPRLVSQEWFRQSVRLLVSRHLARLRRRVEQQQQRSTAHQRLRHLQRQPVQ